MPSASCAPYGNDGMRWRVRRWLIAEVVISWWDSTNSNWRREEHMHTLDYSALHTHYTGERPTLDATRATDLLSRIVERNAGESVTNSDHGVMMAISNLEEIKDTHTTHTTCTITLHKMTNWQLFHEKINQLAGKHNITVNTTVYTTDRIHPKHATTLNMAHTTQTHTQTVPSKTRLTITLWSEELCRNKMGTRKSRIRRAAPLRRVKVKAKYLKEKKHEMNPENINNKITKSINSHKII